ncbi:MAG: protein phosphatase 2C domain-containing protein [Ruminococcus sp.]|nr:protein phosphatase 2C domain-containing protein [Ruminococcus sp.]
MKQICSFNVVQRGARHIDENLPLQDCSYSESGEITDPNSKYTGKYHIAVISDGHGSPQYFRSDRGSKFACEAARDVFLTVMNKVTDITTQKNQTNLKKLIYQQWFDRVKTDFINNPFTQQELDIIRNKMPDADTKEQLEKLRSYHERYKKGEDFQKAYGCTLIAVLFCEKYTLAVQTGDGTCVAFYEDCSCNKPIAADSRSMANQTSSLCDLRPEDCRIHIFGKNPIAVFLASDGMDDSFGQGEGLYNYYRKVCFNFADRGGGYRDILENELISVSRNGSKDDMSIAGIYDLVQLKRFKEIFRKQHDLGEKKIQLYELKDKQGGVSEYSLNAAKSNMEKYEKEYQDKENELKGINKTIGKLKELLNKITNWFQRHRVLKPEERQKVISVLNQSIEEKDREIAESQKKIDCYQKLVEAEKAAIKKAEDEKSKYNGFKTDIAKNYQDYLNAEKILRENEKARINAESDKSSARENFEKARAKYENLRNTKDSGEREITAHSAYITRKDMEISAEIREILAQDIPHEEEIIPAEQDIIPVEKEIIPNEEEITAAEEEIAPNVQNNPEKDVDDVLKQFVISDISETPENPESPVTDKEEEIKPELEPKEIEILDDTKADDTAEKTVSENLIDEINEEIKHSDNHDEDTKDRKNTGLIISENLNQTADGSKNAAPSYQEEIIPDKMGFDELAKAADDVYNKSDADGDLTGSTPKADN